MRFRAVVSYFGKNYVGWQRQLNGLSVQEVLEKALSETGAPTQATASGRTDSGVHAEGQVVHFDADTAIPPEKIPFAVNTLLPRDISMLSCEPAEEDFNARFSAKRKTYRPAEEDFNARFSAKRKTYRYSLYVSRHRRPMLEETHAHVVVPLDLARMREPLDLARMREVADVIEGEHDFKGFEASGSKVKSTVRTVFSVRIESCGEVREGRLTDGTLDIFVTGNGFLYNMVRIIAGTLVGQGVGDGGQDSRGQDPAARRSHPRERGIRRGRMLTVGFETDRETLAELYRTLSLDIPVGGANFVMRENGDPVGLMRAEVGEKVTITHFKVKNEEINPGDKEFFLRAMLFKFSLNPVLLAVPGRRPELERFGFRFEEGEMRLNSAEVDLSGPCHGK